MPRAYLFVDEAGNFDFSAAGSRYLVVVSVALGDCAVGDELLALRRELVWRGASLTDAFHASTDKQRVRDEVFRMLARHAFRVDATIFEKAKTVAAVRQGTALYQLAWYRHMRYVAPRVATPGDDLMVVSATLGTKRQQELIEAAIAGVAKRTPQLSAIRAVCWPAASDPCLQVADYCCWAIQRKWERGDDRSHALIADKIATEYDVLTFR